ncbi:MAG: glycoside hydrolase, partial [Acidobacteriaceae bacterium]|nr:glycoside hydrolase [Acidobacteriaceae bacterium]
HYDRAAIEQHLTVVGEKLMKGFGPNPPYSVFSDSLEVFDTDWTGDFLARFQKRRGYDLVPHLPELTGDATPQALAIRHDWGKTMTELAEEHYLTPIREWAHAHGTLFRSQTYGEPPVILSSNAFVDLAEGEHGPEWRGFSAARWASSANHLYGRNITSTETWTWLHAPSFRATPLDIKAEADLHFIEGINQLIGHGWPYSPPSAVEPGWRFYAAAAFNDHNPWFPVMPEIMGYLQRVSYLMRQGKPANDVAIYLPTDDAWARFRPTENRRAGLASVDRQMDDLLGRTVIPQVLNAGYNFDFIDDRSMDKAGIPYRMLIIPGVERIPLATLERIQAYAEKGGAVIATRRLPSLAPGFRERDDSERIQNLAAHLFSGSQSKAKLVEDESTLGREMTSLLTPDFATAGTAAPAIGFIHRKLEDGELYFFVNTSNEHVSTDATVRVSGMGAEWWDPFGGGRSPAALREDGKCSKIALDLAPYESRVLVFSRNAAKPAPGAAEKQTVVADLSSDWRVTFTGLKDTEQMAKLSSWTDEEKTKFYSGEATYEKTVRVQNAGGYILDFGEGEKVPPPAPGEPGMRALLESPVREAAVVYINGKRAGSIWHPPYQIDISQYIKPGENQLRIEVANLAINEMAGRALPDYRLLNLRYGERFVPQGFKDLKPLPSGMLATVHLVRK